MSTYARNGTSLRAELRSSTTVLPLILRLSETHEVTLSDDLATITSAPRVTDRTLVVDGGHTMRFDLLHPGERAERLRQWVQDTRAILDKVEAALGEVSTK